MVILRTVVSDDFDYLVLADIRSDREDDAIPGTEEFPPGEIAGRRGKIVPFLHGPGMWGWIAEDGTDKARVGMILHRARNRWTEELPPWSVFRHLPVSIFPDDGRFMEIYQLWVEPEYRRRGIGMRLKMRAEEDARELGIGMMYTHTAAKNHHVIALNRKLGYREVRRGTIWDDVVRVSLVKGGMFGDGADDPGR